jgi:predicted DNA-binding transcriptional regulator AlpA
VEKVDPADLLDSAEVAELLGLSSRKVVMIYARRYPDFPRPAVDKARCTLWRRSDVIAWARSTGRQAPLH